MTRLRVTPSRHGSRERLHVTLPDGTSVAWYDRDAGRVSLLRADRQEDVLAALAPYVTGEVSVGPPPVPTPADLDRLSLHPDDDLAPNRPGETLHGLLDERVGGLSVRLGGRSLADAARLLRRDARRDALEAQQLVGDALDQLDGAGWRVVHCVPLPGAAQIDHLAIGPAGVLAVRTLAAHGQRVRLDDPFVRTGRAEPQPHLRWARRAAERATLALATAVRPVLAIAEPARLDAVPAPADVRILRDTEIPALARLGGVLKPADIQSLHAAARDRRTWLRA